MDEVMILTRAVHFGSVLLLIGVFTFYVFVVEPALAHAPATERPDAAAFRRRLMALVWPSVIVAAVSALLWLILVARNMSGRPLTEVLSQTSVLGTVLTCTQFGHDWLLRIAAAIPLVGLVWLKGSRTRDRPTITLDRWILFLSAIVVGALAAAGHASGTAGAAAYINIASDATHLLAAGAWLGALVPLVLFLGEARRRGEMSWIAVARNATMRFSTLGMMSVGVLGATGVLNAWFLVGNAAALIGTDYGRLLVTKVCLFAVMVLVAAINRFKLTPRLSSAARGVDADRATLRQLRRNAVVEVGLGITILLIVGALGMTPPAIHHHH